jgi:hypothetical protein
MSDPVAEGFHPLATQHLPIFVTLPGNTDVLLVAMFVFMVAAVVGIGVFYFKLHSLPEQMAHRGQKVQFEIVAVLGLLSLFTHNHLFWIAGLLLAFVPLPDFSTPLTSMAQSLGKMAGGSSQSQAEGDAAPTGTAGVPLDAEMTQSGTAQVPLDDHRPKIVHGS